MLDRTCILLKRRADALCSCSNSMVGSYNVDPEMPELHCWGSYHVCRLQPVRPSPPPIQQSPNNNSCCWCRDSVLVLCWVIRANHLKSCSSLFPPRACLAHPVCDIEIVQCPSCDSCAGALCGIAVWPCLILVRRSVFIELKRRNIAYAHVNRSLHTHIDAYVQLHMFTYEGAATIMIRCA
jgi:hypothetical protein